MLLLLVNLFILFFGMRGGGNTKIILQKKVKKKTLEINFIQTIEKTNILLFTIPNL
jgi:hypothetical protein